jgi:hypothetical protein
VREASLWIRLDLDQVARLYQGPFESEDNDAAEECRERAMSAPISGRINMGPIRATIVAAFAVFEV